MTRLYLYLLPALLCIGGDGVSASASDEFLLEQIAPGAYLHRGAHSKLEDPARGDSANISFIVGRRCVAVIDSGGSIATGRALKKAISQRTPLPVCYVINTHVHFDHVLGNSAFSGSTIEFVGHQALAAAMNANRDFFADSFASELGGPNAGAQVIVPQLLVAGSLDLDLGERVLTLTAVATAHTSADLTVYDHASDVLWTGDLLFRERMPIIDGSLKGWLAWMEPIMAKRFAAVVPGHGPPDRNWPDGGQDQWRYLQTLLSDVRAAIAKGWFIDEAQDKVAVDELQHWLLTERAHRRNISRVFRELEWE